MKQALMKLIPILCCIVMLSASTYLIVGGLLCGWWEVTVIGCFLAAYSVRLTVNETRRF